MQFAKGRGKDVRPAAETLCRYLQPQFRPVEVEARRAPAEIVAERMARPELRRQLAEILEQAARGSRSREERGNLPQATQGNLPREEREAIVAGPSAD